MFAEPDLDQNRRRTGAPDGGRRSDARLDVVVPIGAGLCAAQTLSLCEGLFGLALPMGLRAELAAATDEAERTRLEAELTALEQSMGHGKGLLRRLFLGWGHRSVPW